MPIFCNTCSHNKRDDSGIITTFNQPELHLWDAANILCDPVGGVEVARLNQLISNATSQHVRSPLTVQTENVAVGDDHIVIVLSVPKGQDKPYLLRLFKIDPDAPQ